MMSQSYHGSVVMACELCGTSVEVAVTVHVDRELNALDRHSRLEDVSNAYGPYIDPQDVASYTIERGSFWRAVGHIDSDRPPRVSSRDVPNRWLLPRPGWLRRDFWLCPACTATVTNQRELARRVRDKLVVARRDPAPDDPSGAILVMAAPECLLLKRSTRFRHALSVPGACADALATSTRALLRRRRHT